MSDHGLSAHGMGRLKLLCSKGNHCVATLTKRRAGDIPIYISVPGLPETEWPREEDRTGMTAAYCADCDQWFSTRSFQLAQSMNVLTDDKSRHEGTYPLSEERI